MHTDRERLIQWLEANDKQDREARADRFEWLSLHGVTPPSMIIRAETGHVLNEAREVFVNGHYISTLLLALAFIEHAIAEELKRKDPKIGSLSMEKAIEEAKERKLFPIDWLDRADRLRLRRNPFAHYKKITHPHTLGMRIQHEKQHPITILETDAKDAIELMYNFLTATLREIANPLAYF